LNFGGYRRELRSDVIFGSEYGISSEYCRPFSGTSNWFFAPRAGFDSTQYPLFQGSTLVALFRNRLALGGLDIGYQFGRTSEVRLGYEGGYHHLSPQVGSSSGLPTISGTTGDTRLQYTFDTFDDPVIPHRGHNIKFDTKYYNTSPGAPHGFPLSELQVENFVPISRSSSLFMNAYGGTSYGFETGIPAFRLGGPYRFPAYGTYELLTNQYVLGQLGYLRELKKLPPLLGSATDFVGSVDLGKISQLPKGPKPPHLPGDITGALVMNTLFGPIEVGAALGNYGRAKFLFPGRADLLTLSAAPAKHVYIRPVESHSSNAS
jgi:NTE family protein